MSVKSTAGRQRSPRVQQKREQARQEILHAAQGLLRESGVEAVTLASVAGELGMTKQAIYHYYPSKEALVKNLVTSLIDEEISVLIAAVEAADSGASTLGTLIRAFYEHYINNLDALRTVYCQSQLYATPERTVDTETVRKEINPQTNHLFDIFEERLVANRSISVSKRQRLRCLAFTAWTSALGMMMMLGIADALDDPLLHSNSDLLDTLTDVFDNASLVSGES